MKHPASMRTAPTVRCIRLALCLGIILLSGLPTSTLANDEGPWMVRAYFGDEGMIREVAQWADHFGQYPEKGFIRLHVDQQELDRLQQAGFYVEVDTERTALIRRALEATTGGSGIPGFPCYRTVEETLATAASLASQYPTLATWIDVGDSWEKTLDPGDGYDLMVLRLTNASVTGPKPKLLVTSAIHAREYSTAELTTRWAERLLADYGIDGDTTWLLDEHEIHLLLQTNPDGRKQAETGLSWRKNANNNYCSNTNDRGADLNRNFSFQWGCCGGSSGSPCSITYRGASAASEPESQAVQNYALSLFPDQRLPGLNEPAPLDATGMYIDVHSFGEIILTSWGFSSTAPPNGDALLRLGRKWGFLDGYRPQLGSTGIVDGSTKDFTYGELGVPGYTLELGTAFFESCSYFEGSIVEGNHAVLEYAAKASRTPYQTPLGPDIVDPTLPPVAVAAGDLVPIEATADDTRYSTENGIEPSQNISTAELYVDVPPWGTSPTPIPLTASDGTFDSTVEDIEVTLDTTGLPSGRHTLFLRSQDTDNNWGAISGLLLHVIDPASAPTLQGFVRDGLTNAPLAATVTANGFETTSDPGTGFYQFQVPTGTYDLTAEIADYGTQTITDIVANDFATVTQDFYLAPFVTFFFDDVETGNVGWTTQAPWAITTESSFSPSHSWTDSPGGNYGSNTNSSLTSPVLDLTGASDPILSFHHQYDLEATFDFGRVEVSTDGADWSEVASFSGVQPTWGPVEIPVPSLAGSATARVRFRLTSDTSVTEDGWHLDDLSIVSPAPLEGPIFIDGFETGDTSRW